MKRLCLFALCVLITTSIGLSYIQKQPVDDRLVIGIAADYAPYISINECGQYEGFDIDIAHALAQQMGKNLELKDLGSMAPLMIALDQESVDMIIWGLTITPSRMKKLAMIHYQGENSITNPLLFWGPAPDNISGLEQMRGKIICVEPSSFQADILTAYPESILLPTERIDDALINIQYGKADAALVDPEIAKKFKAVYPDNITILDIPLPATVQARGMGIAIKQNNHDMIDAVSAAIDQLKADGTIQKYEQKWNLS